MKLNKLEEKKIITKLLSIIPEKIRRQTTLFIPFDTKDKEYLKIIKFLNDIKLNFLERTFTTKLDTNLSYYYKDLKHWVIVIYLIKQELGDNTWKD